MPKSNKSKPERNTIRVLTFHADKPAAPTPANTSTDALADAIRKTWMQNKLKTA